MSSARTAIKDGRFLGVILLGAVAFLLLPFLACDPGDAPNPATGPGSTYDPNFDEPRPGVTAVVRPGTIITPNPVTGDDAEVILVGSYLDSNMNPQAGMQMNFTADPVNPNFSFNPPAAFTDGNGKASTQVRVSTGIPEGSYILVAYTSPAAQGPNARGQTELWVNVGEIVSTPNIPSGPATLSPVAATCPGTTSASSTYATGGSSSNIGNPVFYRFDCGGTVRPLLGAGVTSDTCTFPTAGTYLVRAQAQSSTGVLSDWTVGLTVTVNACPP